MYDVYIYEKHIQTHRFVVTTEEPFIPKIVDVFHGPSCLVVLEWFYYWIGTIQFSEAGFMEKLGSGVPMINPVLKRLDPLFWICKLKSYLAIWSVLNELTHRKYLRWVAKQLLSFQQPP